MSEQHPLCSIQRGIRYYELLNVDAVQEAPVDAFAARAEAERHALRLPCRPPLAPRRRCSRAHLRPCCSCKDMGSMIRPEPEDPHIRHNLAGTAWRHGSACGLALVEHVGV